MSPQPSSVSLISYDDFWDAPRSRAAWQILNKAEGAQKKSSVSERLPGYTVVWATWSPPLEGPWVSLLRRGVGVSAHGPAQGGRGSYSRLLDSRQRVFLPLPQLPTGQARTSGQLPGVTAWLTS